MSTPAAQSSIIFLNGTSSAGKTTLATALQCALGAPYLHVGIDTFLGMAPTCYLNSALPGASQVLTTEVAGRPVVAIRTGAVQERLLLGMYGALAALAAAGSNLIVDDVLLEQRWLRAAVEALAPYRVLFVGVLCPLEVAEERERRRGDRVLGMARGYAAHVHQHQLYDLTVDTHTLGVEKCVSRVRDALERMPAPTAFAQLRARFSASDAHYRSRE